MVYYNGCTSLLGLLIKKSNNPVAFEQHHINVYLYK